MSIFRISNYTELNLLNSIIITAAAIAARLTEILEEFRVRIPIGIPEWEVPILDPFELEEPTELELSLPGLGEYELYFFN